MQNAPAQSNWKYKLSIFDKRIKAFANDYRQNIAIFGNDKEELSFLLDEYFSCNYLNAISCIRLRCLHLDKKDFLENIATSLLSSHTESIDTLDNLINKARTKLPETTRFIQSALRNKNIDFTQILEIINKSINESGKRCLLIIEEFLNLKDIFPDYFDNFVKFMVLQRGCMITLTSSQTKEAEKVISLRLNLLFGNFEKIFINEQGFMDIYHAIENLISPVKASCAFISFFVNIIGDNSLHQKIMAKIIKDNYSREENNALISTITAAIYEKESYFFQKFNRKIETITNTFKDAHAALAILITLSQGYLRKSELMSLNLCEAKKIKTHLQRLCEMGYINNYGNIYKINDPLFSFWLAKAFMIHFRHPSVDILGQKRLWYKIIKEEVTLHLHNLSKDNVAKLSELINAFSDDNLHLGKNYYKLPAVDEAKITSYSEQNLHFLVGEGKKIIFLGIKKDNTQDQDIFDFIEKGSSINGKGIKKIFVALEKISYGARLAAKNNKLEIWDIDEVNNLMRIYNKPIILAE